MEKKAAARALPKDRLPRISLVVLLSLPLIQLIDILR